MNDLANLASSVPARLPVPPLPDAVRIYLRALETERADRVRFAAASPDDRERIHVAAAMVPILSDADRTAAEAAARAIHGETSPIDLRAFLAWLEPVNAAVRNPQPREDFAARARGLYQMLDDLPRGAFTADARRALPAFFPSAADIRSAVEPGANLMLATLRAIQAATATRAATTPNDAPERPAPRTDAERAAARDKVAMIRTELFAAITSDLTRGEARPVRRSPVDDATLLDIYERLAAQGNRAAATRAASLRRAAS